MHVELSCEQQTGPNRGRTGKGSLGTASEIECHFFLFIESLPDPDLSCLFSIVPKYSVPPFSPPPHPWLSALGGLSVRS